MRSHSTRVLRNDNNRLKAVGIYLHRTQQLLAALSPKPNKVSNLYAIFLVFAIPFDWCIIRYHQTITADFKVYGYI